MWDDPFAPHAGRGQIQTYGSRHEDRDPTDRDAGRSTRGITPGGEDRQKTAHGRRHAGPHRTGQRLNGSTTKTSQRQNGSTTDGSRRDGQVHDRQAQCRLDIQLKKFMTPLPPRRAMAWLATLLLWCALPGATAVAAASVAAASGAASRVAEAALPADDSVPGLPATPAPADRAAQAGIAGCAAWTDRCVVCERRPAGRVSCSNIGIACEPQAVQCVRGETAKEDKPPGPKEEN